MIILGLSKLVLRDCLLIYFCFKPLIFIKSKLFLKGLAIKCVEGAGKCTCNTLGLFCYCFSPPWCPWNRILLFELEAPENQILIFHSFVKNIKALDSASFGRNFLKNRISISNKIILFCKYLHFCYIDIKWEKEYREKR